MRIIKTFENFNSHISISIEELELKLKEFRVPLELWGTGYAKTLQHLYEEIKGDECQIKEIDGHLVRFIEFVGIRVLYKQDDEVLVLKEDRQVFKDGRTRRRNMPSSVSEKMKLGEDANISAIRGIEEELGIKIQNNQLIKQRPFYYDGGSQSYPGLKSRYKGNHFTCYLTDEQFNPDGYVEFQKDKSTYFVWSKRY